MHGVKAQHQGVPGQVNQGLRGVLPPTLTELTMNCKPRAIGVCKGQALTRRELRSGDPCQDFSQRIAHHGVADQGARIPVRYAQVHQFHAPAVLLRQKVAAGESRGAKAQGGAAAQFHIGLALCSRDAAEGGRPHGRVLAELKLHLLAPPFDAHDLAPLLHQVCGLGGPLSGSLRLQSLEQPQVARQARMDVMGQSVGLRIEPALQGADLEALGQEHQQAEQAGQQGHQCAPEQPATAQRAELEGPRRLMTGQR